MDVSSIIRKLDGMNDDRWKILNVEFQDQGKFILISLDIDEYKSIFVVQSMRYDLKPVLNLFLKDFDWMVVFKSNNRVFDSLIKGHD